jgi:hypothetical protein
MDRIKQNERKMRKKFGALVSRKCSFKIFWINWYWIHFPQSIAFMYTWCRRWLYGTTRWSTRGRQVEDWRASWGEIGSVKKAVMWLLWSFCAPHGHCSDHTRLLQTPKNSPQTCVAFYTHSNLRRRNKLCRKWTN